MDSARRGFESLSLEGGLEGKMVGVGGWKGPGAVCFEDLKAVGGKDDRVQFLHQTDLDVIQDCPLTVVGKLFCL